MDGAQRPRRSVSHTTNGADVQSRSSNEAALNAASSEVIASSELNLPPSQSHATFREQPIRVRGFSMRLGSTFDSRYIIGVAISD